MDSWHFNFRVFKNWNLRDLSVAKISCDKVLTRWSFLGFFVFIFGHKESTFLSFLPQNATKRPWIISVSFTWSIRCVSVQAIVSVFYIELDINCIETPMVLISWVFNNVLWTYSLQWMFTRSHSVWLKNVQRKVIKLCMANIWEGRSYNFGSSKRPAASGNSKEFGKILT